MILSQQFTGASAQHPVLARLEDAFDALHFDNKAGVPVCRSATVILYLHDTCDGGATYFSLSTGRPSPNSMPKPTADAVAWQSQQLSSKKGVSRPGLRVQPVAGRLIMFWSALPNGLEDPCSLHSAEPVGAGEKWIVTRWFKEV
eukprot:351697-Chlamydomonas_euryale.AAC.9